MNQTSGQAKTPVLDMRGVRVDSLRPAAGIVAEAVSWTVLAGDYWVVGAPQHSGKSDFLMAAGGILGVTAGEICFMGEPMPIFDESRIAHRLRLGFVFDGGQLLSSLTLAENIALPLRYHGGRSANEIESRVHELLETTELVPWANSTPVNVGRSWRQRAGLARALALAPEVLLLDSPLTGLDVRHASWWLGFLDHLSLGHETAARKPVTLVVTADDLRPWRGHANQVACLANRRLLVLGDWHTAEASPEISVQELLRTSTPED